MQQRASKPMGVWCVLISLALIAKVQPAHGCTRVYYETANGTFITARTMDWVDDMQQELWVFPRGMDRNGGVGPDSIKWKSHFGSVVTAVFSAGSVDGMNEEGLAGNILYLAEADYGSNNRPGQVKLSVGAWLQYVLDNFESVALAIDALRSDKINIIAPVLPDGKASTAHMSISDARNDSAILEYIGGQLKIHHDPKYKVMTNSPPYNEQLDIERYWEGVKGVAFLPGTHRAADRFARTSWNLKAMPSFHGDYAVAAVFSLVRYVSVPLGVKDPEKPWMATTQWRNVADHDELRYYFESTASPGMMWVDLDNHNITDFGKPKRLRLNQHLAGEVSHLFEEAEPFPWLSQEMAEEKISDARVQS